jgi:hypothetical protein
MVYCTRKPWVSGLWPSSHIRFGNWIYFSSQVKGWQGTYSGGYIGKRLSQSRDKWLRVLRKELRSEIKASFRVFRDVPKMIISWSRKVHLERAKLFWEFHSSRNANVYAGGGGGSVDIFTGLKKLRSQCSVQCGKAQVMRVAHCHLFRVTYTCFNRRKGGGDTYDLQWDCVELNKPVNANRLMSRVQKWLNNGLAATSFARILIVELIVRNVPWNALIICKTNTYKSQIHELKLIT